MAMRERMHLGMVYNSLQQQLNVKRNNAKRSCQGVHACPHAVKKKKKELMYVSYNM